MSANSQLQFGANSLTVLPAAWCGATVTCFPRLTAAEGLIKLSSACNFSALCAGVRSRWIR